MTRTLAAIALALLSAAPAAAQEEKSKCSAAKLKAVGAYQAALAGCAAKQVAKDLQALDPLCLTRAEQKLAARFEKAERKGDCRTWREAVSMQEILEDGFVLLQKILVPPPSVCCDTGDACVWVTDDATCTAVNGTAGAPGTVCSANACAPPPAAEGPCCEGVTLPSTTEATCVSSPLLDPPMCSNLGGSFTGDAVCLPGRVCVD